MSDLIKSSIQFLEESTGQIDELSKATLGSYLKKASHNVATLGAVTRQLSNDARDAKANDDFTGYLKKNAQADKVFNRSWKRRKSMAAAVDRLTKEDIQELVDNIDQLDEDQRFVLAQVMLEDALDARKPKRKFPSVHTVLTKHGYKVSAETAIDGSHKVWYRHPSGKQAISAEDLAKKVGHTSRIDPRGNLERGGTRNHDKSIGTEHIDGGGVFTFEPHGKNTKRRLRKEEQ